MRSHTFSFLVATALLVDACGSINHYDGQDAVQISMECDIRVPSLPMQGRVQILQVDGSFVGSGHGCPNQYVYQLRPGKRSLRILSGFIRADGNDLFDNMVDMTLDADLVSAITYDFDARYDGASIEVLLKDKTSGAVVASAKSSEIKTQKLSRPDLLPILLLMKK